MLERLIPALLLITGTTGLVYEVVLSRYLALYLGSSGASQAITLAAFLGGMSIGALSIGRLQDSLLARLRHPVWAYALFEGFIGIWMLAFPLVSEAVFDGYSAAMVGTEVGGAISVAARIAVAGLLILPLSFSMGATLPCLAWTVERVAPRAGVRLVSRYYYVNAAGGALGALVGGFVLIEALGLELPLTLCAIANIAVAGFVYRTFRDAPPAATTAAVDDRSEPEDSGPKRASATAPAIGWFVAAATATGLVTLVYEVVWTRLSGLLLGASVYAFALMLFVVIAGISLGSALATRLIAKGRSPLWVFGISQWTAAACAMALLYRLQGLPVELVWLRHWLVPTPDNYGSWLLLGGGFTALHYLPAAMALGAAFPALLAGAALTGARPGKVTGWILGANTAGNLVGALIGGFLLMPLLGIRWVLVAGTCVSLLAGTICLPRPFSLRALAAPIALAALFGGLIAIAPPNVEPVYRGLFRLRGDQPTLERKLRINLGGHTLFRKDGKDVSVSVEGYGDDDSHLVMRLNGKPDGSSAEPATHVVSGHLGFLAVPQAREVMVIGLGTGQTAGAAGSHPTAHVTVAELSEPVVEGARWFADHNSGALTNPRVDVVLADGRDVLRASPDGRYDLIISLPPNPWMVGVSDLFTIEHFELVARKLAPDGVLVQWLPHYEMSDAILRQLLCTLHRVLPHMRVFRFNHGALGIIASTTPHPIDVAAARRAFEQPDVQAELASHKSAEVPMAFESLLAMQLCGEKTVAAVCAGFSDPVMQTFPSVEYRAPRDFYSGGSAVQLRTALDTRRGPDADTLMGRDAGLRTLTGKRRGQVHRFLRGTSYDGESLLIGATAPPDDNPVDDVIKALDLPDPASLDTARHERVCTILHARAPWLVRGFVTMFGPASIDPRAAFWSRRCQKSPTGL